MKKPLSLDSCIRRVKEEEGVILRFYDFAKTRCLHYTGWSRGVDSFLENLLKAKIIYLRIWCRSAEEKNGGEELPLVPQAPLL